MNDTDSGSRPLFGQRRSYRETYSKEVDALYESAEKQLMRLHWSDLPVRLRVRKLTRAQRIRRWVRDRIDRVRLAVARWILPDGWVIE